MASRHIAALPAQSILQSNLEELKIEVSFLVREHTGQKVALLEKDDKEKRRAQWTGAK